MGFGILFLGFFIAGISSLAFSYFAYLIGFLLILAAVGKLRLYERAYSFVLLPLIPLILLSGFWVVCYALGLCQFGEIYPTQGMMRTALEAAFAVLRLLLRELLFFATARLATSVGLGKLRLRAVQNMVVYGIYYFFALIQLTGLLREIPGFDAALMVVYLLVTVLGLVLIASAYRRICPEGEEDAPRRHSRFAFVNRFYETLDQKEQNATQETIDRYRKRQQDRKKK